MEKPLVSICCITYNQEHFIKAALDGFIMQKTNFPFEIVISDDCSKDDTHKIIREYKSTFPDIIRDISPNANMGATPNFIYVQQNAYGKYIALCEGDDYWIDENKLQKQVNYMENHPNCTCCAHNALTLNTETQNIGLFNKKIVQTHDYTLETFISRDWFTPTQSLLYRRDALYNIDNMPHFMHGDYSTLINLLLDQQSYLHYFNDIMAVYRDGGVGHSQCNAVDFIDDFISMLQYYKDKSNHRCDVVFDQMIKHESIRRAMFIQYERDIERSRRWYVYIGHFISRVFAKMVNCYVPCIHVTKSVDYPNFAPIEELK